MIKYSHLNVLYTLNILYLVHVFVFFCQAFPISHTMNKLFLSGKEAGSASIPILIFFVVLELIGGTCLPTKYYTSQHPLSLSIALWLDSGQQDVQSPLQHPSETLLK